MRFCLSAGADAKVSQWALGYEHALSKRTALYAVYADIDNDEAAKDSGLYASIGDAMAGGVAGGDGFQRAVNLGVRHSF